MGITKGIEFTTEQSIGGNVHSLDLEDSRWVNKNLDGVRFEGPINDRAHPPTETDC